MKLYHREWNLGIEFIENKAAVLVLEDPGTFSEIISSIWNQAEGGDGCFILSEGGRELKLEREVECIINPFAMDYNNRKVTTHIIKELTEYANEYYYEEGQKLHSEIVFFLEKLTGKLDIPITFELDPRVTEILKAYNIKVEEKYDSLFERLLYYIRLMNKTCSVFLFIIVNLRQYLRESEIKALYETMFYEKINILSIESKESSFFDCEEVIIIDSNGCMIHF